jgi:hypothetical protein
MKNYKCKMAKGENEAEPGLCLQFCTFNLSFNGCRQAGAQRGVRPLGPRLVRKARLETFGESPARRRLIKEGLPSLSSSMTRKLYPLC